MRTPTQEELKDMLLRFQQLQNKEVEPLSPFEVMITYKFLLQYEMV